MRISDATATRLRCIAATLSILLLGCQNDARIPLKLGYVPVGDSAPLYVAVKAGIFRDNGLDVELIEVAEGPLIIAGAVKGDLDGGSAGIAPILNALGRDAPIRIVGDGGHIVDRPRPPVALVTLSSSPYRTLRDLAGKKIAITGPRTIEDALVSVAAQNAGLERGSITFVPVPQESKIPVLLRGDVQAALLVEPYVSEALKEHPIRVMLSAQQMIPDFQQALIFFTEDTLAKKKPAVERFLRSYEAALDYIARDPDYAKTAISERLKRKLSPDLIRSLSLLGWDKTPNVERMRRTQDVLRRLNVAAWPGDIGTKVVRGSP
jgi:NitT/TauT family transport system substrate-binding protein